jgi:peptidoglycan hydrolase-like protein with peptidoglycan-binding domain
VRGNIVLAAAALMFAVPAARAAVAVPDPQIAGLQVVLQSRGLYRGPVDGVAGPLTAAAVSKLQRTHGLLASGRADRRTVALLGPIGAHRYASRLLHRGMAGLDVAALQFELRRHAFPNPGRGYFAESTERALRRFQGAAGLKPDGIAGLATYAALARPLRPKAALARVSPQLRSPLSVRARAVTVTIPARAGQPAGRAAEILCPYATAVAVVVAGTVRFAGNRDDGYGYTVVIRREDGLQLLYAHLARIDVHVGDRVIPGAFLGLAGWTGKQGTTQTSLRLELSLDGRPLDPIAAIASLKPSTVSP